MRTQHAHVILVQPYQNRKTAETVARQTGARVLDMPQQPGAVKDATTYFTMMDHLIRTLANGLQGGQGTR
jgi:ABC-type Zn uptake system ZnuABC Zn-binding protein ZnuA